MWPTRLSLPLAVVLSIRLAHAQSSTFSSCDTGSGAGGAFTINSQADADLLSACASFTGDVAISASASGNITLNGLVTVDGAVSSLPAGSGNGTSSGLTAISSSTLTTITGNLAILSLDGLRSFNLSKLKTVGGALQLAELPALVDLHLEMINSVGSFSLVSAPNLRTASIGVTYLSEDPDVGLKHITSATDATIEVRDVGLEDLIGIMDLWNASMVELAELPNLDDAFILTGHAGEVRIRGNGNLTLHMAEGGWTGIAQPVIGKLNITGVKQVSPCLCPDVHEFIAVNNTVEYLHFCFNAVQRLEIRDNEHLKTLVPWNGENLYEWNLTDVLIRDNPLLLLSEFPPRSPDDNLTAIDCPYMFSYSTDEWEWYPFHMNSVVIAANIDNSFFKSFIDPWFDTTLTDRSRAEVLQDFEVSSTNTSFSCSQLNTLRSGFPTFPGTYSCQGHTQAAANISSSSPAVANRPWSPLLVFAMSSSVAMWL